MKVYNLGENWHIILDTYSVKTIVISNNNNNTFDMT